MKHEQTRLGTVSTRLVLFVAVAVVACSGAHQGADTGVDGDTAGDADGDGDTVADVGVDGGTCDALRTSDVDLLVVWDNAGVGLRIQERFLEALPALEAELPARTSLHVAAVSTDLGSGEFDIQMCDEGGDDGVLRACAETGQRYLDGKGEAVSRFLDCVLPESDMGCGFEMYFEAAWRALTSHTGVGEPNEGFLRDDSVLAVVFVGNEDDCSTDDFTLFGPDDVSLGELNTRCALHPDRLTPVSRYIDRFRALRTGCEERLVTAAITGVPVDWSGDLSNPALVPMVDPGDTDRLVRVCGDGETDFWAVPSPRIAELSSTISGIDVAVSTCASSYAAALTTTGQLIATAMGE